MFRRWVAEGDDTAIDNAVEELLRYDTPVLALARNALVDAEVGGRTVPAGSAIVVSLSLANRDVRRFPDADQLRLDRIDPRPLSTLVLRTAVKAPIRVPSGVSA